jgi:2-methylcitrate dehydratase PrpD
VNASRSWYVTGLTGGVGAAAALGKVIGLSHEQMCSAIGIGAMQASGTRASHASDAIALVPGLAARNGVAAALLAEAGLVCNVNAIDGRHGLLDAIAPDTKPATLVHCLGKTYELSSVSYKPYPCGIVIHPTIDACLDLRVSGNVASGAIERIEMDVQADTLTLCWRKLPTTELEAQVSLYHWAAAALVFGAAGVEQGRIAAVNDPEVRALQDLMHARVDPALARDQARVTIVWKDGEVCEGYVDHAIGSIDKPMTQAQLDEKFIALCTARLGDRNTASLLEMCRDPKLDQNVTDLFRYATPLR